MESGVPHISVIVPVLNEARLIDGFIRRLQNLAGRFEIIVVDGGSADDTARVAGTLADRVLTAPCGRASQMNAGAAVAGGNILWFVHADLTPPPDAIERIGEALDDPKLAGGCFSLRYPRTELIYRVSDSLGNLGVRLFGFALGDHGIFCRRSAFLQAGAYPIVPILEDAEIYFRLRAIGRMKQLREEIVSDPRTFEKWGCYRTTAVYFLILVLYVAGVPISRLNKIYRRLAARARLGGGDRLGRDPSKRACEAEFG